MILAIDFDNTIHNIKQPEPNKRMGPPIKGAEDALDTLYMDGHKIIIHSTRATTPSGKKSIQDWLDHYGIDYHEITATKPQADFYIDDKAIKHETWAKTLDQLGVSS